METISINLIPGGILPSIHVSQNDVGRQFRLNLLEGSVGHILDGTEDVTIEIGKPDNHIVTAEVTNTSSNYVVIETTDQMTACPGKCLCEIRIAKDGVDIGTANFNLVVECSPIAGGIESGSVIHDIEHVVSDLVEEDVPEFVTPYLLTANANGNPAIFTDGAKNVPVGELVTAITAKQDLHGYDKPWPAGGGKNKADASAFETGVVNTDGTIVKGNTTINSQGNGEVAWTSTATWRGITSDYIPVKANTSYRISLTETPLYVLYAWYQADKTFISRASYNASNPVAITSPSNGAYVRFTLQESAIGSYDYHNIQFEEGSPATSYAPYENICPITGYTEANVARTGKNLFRFGDQSGERRTDIINLDTPLPAGDYTISAIVISTDTDSTTNIVEFIYEDNTTQYVQLSRNTRSSYARTLTKTVIGIRFYASNNNANSAGDTFSFKDIQLESGSTATDYEPFLGSINVLNFGQTVYGGSLNVTTGVLTIDKGFISDLSQLTWDYQSAIYTNIFSAAVNGIYNVTEPADRNKWFICSEYAPSVATSVNNSMDDGGALVAGTRIKLRNDAYNGNLEGFVNSLSGVQFAYRLAEPIVIQLTPAEISTIYGLNIVSSNCGEIAVEYRADVGLYINNLPKELPEVTAADNGKILGVSGGVWTKVNGGGSGGSDLPIVGPADAGKVLTVDSTGNWVADEVPEELPAVTSSDNGKVLGVSSGAWTKVPAPSGLPSATSADEGKLLGVDSNGNWGKTNPFAEETWTFTLSDNTTVTKTLLVKVVSE